MKEKEKTTKFYGLSTMKKLQNNNDSSLQNKPFRWVQTFNVTTALHAHLQKVADWVAWGWLDCWSCSIPVWYIQWYWSLWNLLGSMGLYWWFTFTYNERPQWLGKVLLFYLLYLYKKFFNWQNLRGALWIGT